MVYLVDILYYIAGVLITGGYPDSNMAELYVPSTGASCTLPSLPSQRRYHTVTETGLLCGGGCGSCGNCIQWSSDSGSWKTALSLDVGRYEHVSWTPSSGNIGTYLMGGYNSKRTSTLIANNGSLVEGFLLKYDTM